MTRQDELNEAWCKYRGKCSTEIMQALAFALRWCDEHPNWISVEDGLPPFGQVVLAYYQQTLSFHEPVGAIYSTAYGGSIEMTQRLSCYDEAELSKLSRGIGQLDENGFEDGATIGRKKTYKPRNVTHWMPIPPLPSASEKPIDRTNKKGG